MSSIHSTRTFSLHDRLISIQRQQDSLLPIPGPANPHRDLPLSEYETRLPVSKEKQSSPCILPSAKDRGESNGNEEEICRQEQDQSMLGRLRADARKKARNTRQLQTEKQNQEGLIPPRVNQSSQGAAIDRAFFLRRTDSIVQLILLAHRNSRFKHPGQETR